MADDRQATNFYDVMLVIVSSHSLQTGVHRSV